ncbi:hypothetical protein CFP71_23225 [Amycolatopsis thailandensis]|uniref:Uncharacterized protein n=1 Tax=Amycolatopsis thailandensis TaxID=589330 RepID=A0A229S1X7_9PSEU|nr:hypothetical protein CFP71_23225 [Amycolatopsis thailandensis]
MGEKERDELDQFLKALDTQGSRFEERRAAAEARAAARKLPCRDVMRGPLKTFFVLRGPLMTSRHGHFRAAERASAAARRSSKRDAWVSSAFRN